MIDRIDDEIELYYDLANELLKYFWLGLLIYNMENPDSIFTFYQYMKPISDNAKGFMYEFDFDDKRKLKGVVWQT